MEQIVCHVISGNQMEKKKSQLSLGNKGETAACVYRVKTTRMFLAFVPSNIVRIIKKMDIKHKSEKNVYRHEQKKKSPGGDEL